MSATVTRIEAGRKGKVRLFKFATGTTAQSKKVKNVEMTLEEFEKRLSVPVRTQETHAQYLRLPLQEQNQLKDVGYLVTGHFANGIRKIGNISQRHIICLDIDHAGPNFADDCELYFGNIYYILHSTRKHSKENPRYRLYIPLSRGVDEIEYQAVARRIASWFDMDAFDDTTYQFSRVMFWPSCSADQEYIFKVNKAALLTPDDVLKEYDDFRDAATWPVSSRVGESLRISAQKAGNPTEKPGIVGSFCRTYGIRAAIDAFIPEAYVDGFPEGRLTYAHGSAANGAVIYDNDLFLYSHHEHDPCSLRLVNAWDMVRLHKFGSLDENIAADTPLNKRPSSEAMRLMALEDPHVKSDYILQRIDDLNDFEEVLDGPEEDDGLGDDDDLDAELGMTPKALKLTTWHTNLRVTEKGALVACLTNLELMWENDPRLKGSIAFNDFTKELRLMRTLPGMRGDVPQEGILWEDLHELKLKSYWEYTYKVTFSVTAIHEAACTIGDRHAYHPVKAYLDALEWDGVPRVETFFIRYYGAPDTPYTRAVTRKFFAACVARIYRPGTKFDYMLVLEGAEGLRKSSLFDVLSLGHFTDSMSFGLDAKEVIEVSRNAWIVEIPELVTRSSAENEHVKAFLSRRTDRARMAYGRNAADFPRQFVLAGTTNESFYLRSQTGNRRFWSLSGDGRVLNLEAILGERDQLWAESCENVRFGEPLYLEDETVLEAARAEQDKRVVKDDLAGHVGAWLEKPIAANYWDLPSGSPNDFDDEGDLIQRDRVSALEVWIECMGGELRTFTQRDARRIGDILRSVPGWRAEPAVRFGARYGRTRGFLREKVT